MVVPGLMSEDGVRADAQDLGSLLFELVVIFSGLLQFRGTDKGKICGIEQQYQPLPLIVGKLNFFGLVVLVNLELEIIDEVIDLLSNFYCATTHTSPLSVKVWRTTPARPAARTRVM